MSQGVVDLFAEPAVAVAPVADRVPVHSRISISPIQAASDTEMPLRSLVYTSLAAQKLRNHSRSLGESWALVVVSMVLYHGAGPWNAPVTAEELVPGLTEYILVRPEAADPDNARAEDIPGLVLSSGTRADARQTGAQAGRPQARAGARHRPAAP